MKYCIRGGGYDGEPPFFIAEHVINGENIYMRCGRVDWPSVKRFETYDDAVMFLCYLEDMQMAGRLPMWHYLDIANEQGEVVDP